MNEPVLSALRAELERHWCAETSFWPDRWTPARPALGQCAVTALTVNDLVGGEILRTTNLGVVHYWNRVDGVDIDLTRDQFDTWSPEGEPVTVDREDLVSSGPTLAARYSRLTSAFRAGPLARPGIREA